MAIENFIRKGILPDEDIFLHLDERNERAESRYFLEDYLNTQLCISESVNGPFLVEYLDSKSNRFVQIADMLSNVFWSNQFRGQYEEEIQMLEEAGILRGVFEYPR